MGTVRDLGPTAKDMRVYIAHMQDGSVTQNGRKINQCYLQQELEGASGREAHSTRHPTMYMNDSS